MDEQGRPGSSRINRIVELFKEANTEDYDSVREKLREARELVHEQIAEQLTEPLNRRLAAMPKDKFEDKQELVRFANSEMRALGVTLSDDLGRPAKLHTDSGSHAREGRFQLELVHPVDRGKRPTSSIHLFEIRLMGWPNRGEYTGVGYPGPMETKFGRSRS